MVPPPEWPKAHLALRNLLLYDVPGSPEKRLGGLMTLGYIRKGRKNRDVEWRAILAFLEGKRSATASEVAKEFHLGRMITTQEQRGGNGRIVTRQRDTGPSEASVRLNRLVHWGMASRTKGDKRKQIPRTYTITDYGRDVSANPSAQGMGEAKKAAPKEKKPSDKLIKGPVALMRVQEVTSAEDVTRRVPQIQVIVEKKLDGWLMQIAGGRVYTRRGIEISKNFPDLYQETRKWAGEHVIGELVYWTPEGKMDESTVTRVANVKDPMIAIQRKKGLPGRFQIVTFDILAREGDDITNLPFTERRMILEKFIHPNSLIGISGLYPFKDWEKAYKEAISIGGEGVVFKNMDSIYMYRELNEREPSPSNTWWKLKEHMTDDFIVFNLSFSEKEKMMLHFGQLWKGRMIKVGEVNNLSAEMEQEMARRMLEGPFVVEIKFDARFSGSPGSLRNPRFARFRDDKPMDSVQLPEEHAP